MRGELEFETLFHLPGADGVLWLHSGVTRQIFGRIDRDSVLRFAVGLGVGGLRLEAVLLGEERRAKGEEEENKPFLG